MPGTSLNNAHRILYSGILFRSRNICILQSARLPLLLILLPLFVVCCSDRKKKSTEALLSLYPGAKIAQTNTVSIHQVNPLRGDSVRSNFNAYDEILESGKEILALPNFNSNCNLKDSRGHLWFGSSGNGIIMYNGMYWTHLIKNDGLVGNMVYDIIEDSEGNIWMSTSEGLSMYNGLEFKNFTQDSELIFWPYIVLSILLLSSIFILSSYYFKRAELPSAHAIKRIKKENSGESVVYPPAENYSATILIVEDNNDLRKYIAGLLVDRFYIITAENGQIGLDKATEMQPDMVISAQRLPVMGGLELCKRLKGHPATNHIPLIMLAAKEDKDIQALEMEVSADEYIEKPFDADLLMARVDNMIRQRQELQRLFQKDYFSLDVSEDIASAQFAVLREIIEKFDEHISDSNYNLESLCEELNISRSQLFRKIKALSNTTPNELLRMIRIKRAAQLLRKNHMNVTQVMLQIGYRTPSHFAASFRKYYGVNPGEYRNQYNNSTNP